MKKWVGRWIASAVRISPCTASPSRANVPSGGRPNAIADRPVSNSGRLKALLLEVAQEAGWPVDVELSFNPDKVLSQTDQIIATSDGVVLERCHGWVNLARLIIAERIPSVRVLDLSERPG